MKIVVLCACRARLEFPARCAGMRVVCSACGDYVDLPEQKRNPQFDPKFERDQFLVDRSQAGSSGGYYVRDDDGAATLFVERPTSELRNVLFYVLAVVWIGVVIYVAATTAPPLRVGEEGKHILHVLLALAAGAVGYTFLAFVLTPPRRATFYHDDSRQEIVMTLRRDLTIPLLNSRYTLRDDLDLPIASFTKSLFFDGIRSRWYIAYPTGGAVCTIREDSLESAILRRCFPPLRYLMPPNFLIQTPDLEETIGHFERKIDSNNRYALDFTADAERRVDRRIVIGIGTLLDMCERRGRTPL